MSEDEFRRRMEEDLREFATAEVDGEKLEWLLRRLRYVSGDLNDVETFTRLKAALEKVDEELGTGGSYLFYLAVPPGVFDDFVLKLGESGLTKEEEGRWRRVIVEKPFGHDLESARALNRTLREVLRERQIYRIDHYLGKETVQNIMVFRFANGIFEPIWNRRYVDHVQITVAETVGVEGRGGYYEEAGALRDMVQNHMFQLLAFTAMEPPISFAADAVRDEQVKVLYAIRPMSPEDVLRRTRARPVRRRNVRRQAGAGLSRGEVGGARLEHRDLRGAQAVRRQLALGRRAVLSAHRQAPAEAGHRDRDPVQARAVHAVPRHAGGAPDAQRAGAAHPAGRRDLAALRRQGAGPARCGWAR